MKNKNGTKRKDLLMVPVNQIVVEEGNNYAQSTRGDIGALAQSIAHEGVQNPLKCYKDKRGNYILQSGFRRMAAVKLISKDKKPIERVPVLLEERYANEADRAIRQLLENAHREDATPIEKAKAYRKLIDAHGLEAEEVAERLGENIQTVNRYLTLLQASQPIRKAMEQGVVGITAAAQIVKKNPDDPEAQKKNLELAIQASGGRKAKVKETQVTTRIQGPRQKTKTVNNVKDALDNVNAFQRDSVLHSEVANKYKAYEKTLKWMLNAGQAPWE